MGALPDHLQPVPAGRRKLPREVMEEHQRARILDGAIEVFAEKGYPASTVDDVVAAARIGVGSFYAYFGGKEECLLGAYERTVEELEEVVVGAGPEDGTWASRLCLGLRTLLDWIAAEPQKARIVLVEVQAGGPQATERYAQTLGRVAEFLRLGRESPDADRRLPAGLEQTNVNGIAWLLHHRLSLGEGASVPDLFEGLAQMVLEPYLGEVGARQAIAETEPTPSA